MTYKKNIEIKGMHCSHCAKNVEEALKTIKNIKKVKVNLKKNTATITSDENIEDKIIKNKINEAGYSVENIKTESKKTFFILLAILCLLTLTACEKQETKEDAPPNLKEIEGPVVKAKLDENQNIIIKESDITTTATYISYEVDSVTIGLLAVKDSKGEVKVVINTCNSCGGAPYAYFVQVGDKIQCQNCGNTFDIDSLDELTEDGCNPVKIDEMTKENGIITIGTSQLKNLKDKFEDWKGPKA